MNRADNLQTLRNTQNWDVIVIGGGASGLGAAVDAASRGFSTLLLEAHDFAKATSSRSTKLAHGGVRYLAQGHIDLVIEALHERGLLAKNASHLVKNQTFIIPNYQWWEGYYYQIGLSIYDWLARKLRLGKTKRLNKTQTLAQLPTLKADGLASGIRYYDGQFDDARLAINLAQTLQDQGGCALNYVKVIDLIKDDKQRISGVVAEDSLSGERFNLHCKAVVNATGVFTDSIMQLDKPSDKAFVVPSQGIHLVLARDFLQSEHALMIPKTDDGRVLFAVPWHGKVIIGTTDVRVERPELEPKPLAQEIDFILQTAANYLTKAPTKADVLSVFAGLRPLAAPEKEGQKSKEVSRSHKVHVSDSGLVTIIGGKWTTYRKMAEDTIDKAIENSDLPNKACVSETLAIHGNRPTNEQDRQNHLYLYGSDAPAIEQLSAENPDYKQRLHPKYPYTLAEVVWAIREEMAQSVEDILARRVRLLFLDARAAIESAQSVARLIASERNHSQEWIDTQIQNFTTLAKGYLLTEN